MTHVAFVVVSPGSVTTPQITVAVSVKVKLTQLLPSLQLYLYN